MSADLPAGTPPPMNASALFHLHNLDTARMHPWHWLVLVLWTPVGLPLMLLRAAGAILASVVVPPRYRAWWVTSICGIFLRVRDKTRIRDHGVVVVSNHLSYVDGMTVRAAVRSSKPLATLLWHKVNRLNQVMARPVLLVKERGRNRQLIEQVQRYLEHGNVLLFPEATVTDGFGVLRFERMAFSLEARVVLVAVRYRRPLTFLHPSALRQRLLVQVLVDLFQPWTVAEIHCLGVETRGQDETAEAFAVRAQHRIAGALGVPGTEYTWRDRRALMAQHGRL